MHTREEKLEAFGRLLDVLDQLREKCPWDKKQTNESLRPNTIEETFELCDALMKNDVKEICKELGDVLMHVMFYARIGSETDDFDMADVCNRQADKLIFRHPHIYDPSQVGQKEPLPLDDPRFQEKVERPDVKTAEQVLQNWEQITLPGPGVWSSGQAMKSSCPSMECLLRGPAQVSIRPRCQGNIGRG